MKKHISYLFTLSCLTMLAFAGGCTEAEQDRNLARGEAAWNDFKTAAERTEREASLEWQEAKYEINEETNEWTYDYDRNVARADSYAGNWDENRKREYSEIKERFRTAEEKRRTNYDVQKRSKVLTASLLGGMLISDMTALNVRNMYETFVKNVDPKKANFTKTEWEAVDRIWEAMNEQYERLDDVPSRVQAEIAKEKAKYNAYKTGAAIDRNI